MKANTKAFFAALVPRTLRAAIDACYEVGATPYIAIILNHPEVSFTPYPAGLKPAPATIEHNGALVELSTLTLNLDVESIRDYMVSDLGLSFKCRFNGAVSSVFVPYQAIAAVTSPDLEATCPIPIDYEALVASLTGVNPPPVRAMSINADSRDLPEQPKAAPSFLRVVK